MMQAWWRESRLRRMVYKNPDPEAHWSELSETGSSLSGEEVAADNREVFKTLQLHPDWGRFFLTFNEGFNGTLAVGEKFAEGGQAELFDAYVTWNDPLYEQYCSERKLKLVLKVFKEGTYLRHLQGQWPHGFLKWQRDLDQDTIQHLMSPSLLYKNNISCGTMLEDGRFAFLMWKREADLQSYITQKMHGVGHDCGPFSNKKSEICMYQVALGVLWLHENDVAHRDLKAANILIHGDHLYVADYECSIGVVGTGFWRAPEILQASKDYTTSQKPELFTKAGDIYSYAMVCYEILTGKAPFENEKATRDSVIGGQRLMLPRYIDEWVCTLLHKCWEFNPEARPSIQEILSTIATNTSIEWIKDMDVARMNTKVTDVERLQLGCDNSTHTFERMECIPCDSGVRNCRLCLKTCNENVYKCKLCPNCNIHPACAHIEGLNMFFRHPHVLRLPHAFTQHERDVFCDGCGLKIGDELWYMCTVPGCKYELHVVCAKYVERIAHPIHKEHELVLSTISSITNLDSSIITCGSCLNQIDTVKVVYHCKECGFNIHPKCAIGLELQRFRIVS